MDRILEARRAPDLAVLEGFHALKHALRFEAEILEVVAGDPEHLEQLATALAPDLEGRFTDLATKEGLPQDEVLTVARRPVFDLEPRSARPGPVVYWRRPGTWATSARRSGSPPPRTPRPCSPAATTTPGTPTRSAAPPACTSRCPSRASERRAGDARSGRLIAVDPDGEERAGPARHDPRLRLRAPRPQRGAARRRRRAGANPHARRRLEPEPGDLGGRRALRPHGAVVERPSVESTQRGDRSGSCRMRHHPAPSLESACTVAGAE